MWPARRTAWADVHEISTRGGLGDLLVGVRRDLSPSGPVVLEIRQGRLFLGVAGAGEAALARAVLAHCRAAWSRG
jgi:hypothetical protein